MHLALQLSSIRYAKISLSWTSPVAPVGPNWWHVEIISMKCKGHNAVRRKKNSLSQPAADRLRFPSEKKREPQLSGSSWPNGSRVFWHFNKVFSAALIDTQFSHERTRCAAAFFSSRLRFYSASYSATMCDAVSPLFHKATLSGFIIGRRLLEL